MKEPWTTKRIWICLAVATVWFAAADTFGQAEKPKISINSTAKMTREKPIKIDDEVETVDRLTITTGSIETETCTVAVTLKNGGDQPVKGQLKWGFVSDHSSGKSKPKDRYSPSDPVRTLFGSGKKEVTLPAGEAVTESIISQPFVYEEKTVEIENYNNNSSSQSIDYETGDVYKGYLVLFTVNGENVATKASTSSYAKEEWIQQLK